MKIISKINKSLNSEVSGDSLVFLRFVFGFLMVLELLHYSFGRLFINEFYIEPSFHFKYPLLEWIPDIPSAFVSFLVGVLILLYSFISVGFLYRISTVLATLGFSWLFLSERSSFLNHWYLICLVTFLLIFSNANQNYSLDKRLGLLKKKRPNYLWQIWMFRILMLIVYFYAALAKIGPDWTAGQPLKLYLEGANLPEWISESAILLSYITIVLQLGLVVILLWKRTVLIGFVLACVFHLSNKFLFDIGFFPEMSILLTTLFFSPNWLDCFRKSKRKSQVAKSSTSIIEGQPVLLTKYIMGGFIFIQLILPLRQFIYSENLLWAEQGTIFSWKMLTEAKFGEITFTVKDGTSLNDVEIDPEQYGLSTSQESKLLRSPDLILQYAHYLGSEFKKKGYNKVEVFANSTLGLNGRKVQLFVHPNVDLMKEEIQILEPYKWVIPISESLP